MADDRQIYQQVPHEVMITKSLFGVEPRTDGVEYSARTNQREEWGRAVVPEEREEDHDHPTHN